MFEYKFIEVPLKQGFKAKKKVTILRNAKILLMKKQKMDGD